jgi:hypothetical protein
MPYNLNVIPDTIKDNQNRKMYNNLDLTVFMKYIKNT